MKINDYLKRRNIFIGILTAAALTAISLSVFLFAGDLKATAATGITKRDLPYYLADMNYSSNATTTKNVNAVNGGAIILGQDTQAKQFASGVSVMAKGNSVAAYVEITLSEVHTYSTFATEYGIDYSQRTTSKSATVVLLVDGAEKVRGTTTANIFHKQFNVSVEGKRVVRLEVYADEGVCVSFGDAAFYENGASAISKLVDNIKLGGWAAPLARNYNLYGADLYMGGVKYDYGYCVNSVSSFDMTINGNYNFFEAWIGIDDGVAGGAAAGSVTVEATSYDDSGKAVGKFVSPVLYGYMSAYKMTLDVKGATKISFAVKDGGDGIANDMTVIASPVFTQKLTDGKIYLSDLPFASSNVGYGAVGRDKQVDGSAFSYQIYATSLNYNKGVGLHLVNKPYSDYQADKTNHNNFAYVAVDVEGRGYEFFEALVMDPASSGAYYELWADGECLASSGLIKGFTSSGHPYPYRISARLPQGAKTFEIRAITDTVYNDGKIDFVNAAFYTAGASLCDRSIEEETISSAWPFPVNRYTVTEGSYPAIITSGGDRRYYDSLVSNSVSSYKFDIEGTPYDTFTATLGLAWYCGNGDVTFGVCVEYTDGTTADFTSPRITADNSGYPVSFYYGENARYITLSVYDNGNPADDMAVWCSPKLIKTTLNDVEYVTDIQWNDYAVGWGSIGVNRNVVGGDLIVNGVKYDNGICLHAFSDKDRDAFVEMSFPASYGYSVFEAWIGVNKDTQNNGGAGSVIFYVEGDGEVLYRSGLMRVTDAAEHIIVDIRGISVLRLAVNNGDGSYDCDWADFLNAKIAKSITALDACIDVFTPVDNQAVVPEESTFTVSGRSVGADNNVTVLVNGAPAAKIVTDGAGYFSAQIAAQVTGDNVITVRANGTEKSVTVKVAGAKVGGTVDISTLTTKMKVTPAENGMIVSSLTDENGYEWLTKESFVPFMSKVRFGGKNAPDTVLNWVYKCYRHYEEDTRSENIDSNKDAYIGTTAFYEFDYEDTTGKLKLTSRWYHEVGFESPIMHEIDIENVSGDVIYVYNGDTTAITLSRAVGARVTNSYAYKSEMYTTNYGYREDEVVDGYDMNVFCTTDYNNGMQIDCGYIPWASINQTYPGGNNGVYFGVFWPDCRVQVAGIGKDVYVEAGLDEDFFTEIPAGYIYGVPATFTGAYVGDVDDGSNSMKRWYYAFYMPECNRVDNKLPSFEYNFWEVLDTERRSWRMDDSKFYTAVKEFSEIGVDEICIDTYWWKNVGDWRGVHEKWQSSMEYSSDFVNALGMYFTIYMQAGNGLSTHTDALTTNGVHGNPNWFARGEGLSWDEVCLADPDAFGYLCSYLSNYFMEFGLDGIRTDFGYILGYCAKDGHMHIDDRADVGYWTSYNTFKLWDMMCELFPIPTDVEEGSEVHYFRWENCNCGGTLKDFLSMSYAARIQTTDAYSPSEVRRSFFDESYCHPSMQQMLWLNDYMYDPTGPIEDDQYRFFSILMGAGCPMMSMLSDMPLKTQETLARTIEIYHDWMQFLVRYADTYHITDRYDGVNWDGMEYYDKPSGKGAALLFKPDPDGSVSDTYRVKMKGLDALKTYYVWTENGSVPFATYTGAQLTDGLDVTLTGSYRAEIIYFIATDGEGAADIVSKPRNFDVTVSFKNDALETAIGSAANGDYYVVSVAGLSGEVYSYVTRTLTPVRLRGLSAGDYTVNVTAFNRFGSTAVSTDINISVPTLTIANVTVTGNYSTDDIIIDGERYVGGYRFDLNDTTFGVSSTKTFTVKNISDGVFNARFALPDNDEEERLILRAYDGDQLIGEYEFNADNRLIDVRLTLSEGTSELKFTVENVSESVYFQTNHGYGRMGMYSSMGYSGYEFSASVKVLRNGLNETFPRAGIFGAYIDDTRFSAIYIDAYYSNIVVYHRENGRSTDSTVNYRLENFDYKAAHVLSAVRSGREIKYYVDGEYLTSRYLSSAYANAKCKVAILTEDVEARFGSVSLKENGTAKDISWVKKNVNVDINGKNVYGTNTRSGEWSRLSPKLIMVPIN